MPRASTAPVEDKVLRYQPLRPPLEQAKFPHCRKSVRRTPASSTRKRPTLTESQSTCTQYFARTPNTSFTEISDDEKMSDSGSDFDDDRPAKKQKTAKKGGSGSNGKKKRGGLFDQREPDQQSYTQMMRAGPLHKKPRYLQTDTQGWQLPKLEDEKMAPIERVRRQQQKREGEKLEVYDLVKDDSGYDTRHSSQLRILTTSSPTDRGQLDEAGCEFKHRMSPKQTLRTPKNVRFEKVIPSSQSPVSPYQLSTQKSQRIKDVERSPLKERSINMPSPTKSMTTPKKVELEAFVNAGNGPISEQAVLEDEAATPRPRQRRTPRRPAHWRRPMTTSKSVAMPPPPISLKQKSTILNSSFVEGAEEIMEIHPDSEPSQTQLAAALSNTKTQQAPLPAATTTDDEVEPGPPVRQPRQLKRVSTIQDSETEDVDLDEIELPDDANSNIELSKSATCVAHKDEQLSEPVAMVARSLSDEAQDSLTGLVGSSGDGPFTYGVDNHVTACDSFNDEDRQSMTNHHNASDEVDRDYEMPQTYDPVYSALDRDAARCDQTQSHFQRRLQPYVSNTSAATGDEEIRASQQLLQEFSDAIARIPTSQLDEQHQEQVTVIDEERVPSSQHEFGNAAISASDNAAVAKTPMDEERVPSSPPIWQSAGLQAEAITGDMAQQQVDDAAEHALGLNDEAYDDRINSHGVRISQISTVMPTQMSPRSLRYGHSDNEPLPAGPDSSHQCTTQHRNSIVPSQGLIDSLPLSSPSKQSNTAGSIGTETFPSSPLPLPPWSSPGRAQNCRIGLETQEYGTMGSNIDFSLPPPPPMSSSSRVGTQRGVGGSSSPLR